MERKHQQQKEKEKKQTSKRTPAVATTTYDDTAGVGISSPPLTQGMMDNDDPGSAVLLQDILNKREALEHAEAMYVARTSSSRGTAHRRSSSSNSNSKSHACYYYSSSQEDGLISGDDAETYDTGDMELMKIVEQRASWASSTELHAMADQIEDTLTVGSSSPARRQVSLPGAYACAPSTISPTLPSMTTQDEPNPFVPQGVPDPESLVVVSHHHHRQQRPPAPFIVEEEPALSIQSGATTQATGSEEGGYTPSPPRTRTRDRTSSTRAKLQPICLWTLMLSIPVLAIFIAGGVLKVTKKKNATNTTTRQQSPHKKPSVMPPTTTSMTTASHFQDDDDDDTPPHIKAQRWGAYTSLFVNNLDSSNKRTIPSEIALLTSLAKIDLSANHLSSLSLADVLPLSVLGQMTALTDLWLDHNALTGTIPSELGLLTSLTALVWNDNLLTGTIMGSELGLLTALQRLHWSGNQLSGTIPTHVASLTSLTSLSLSDNRLTWTIASQLASMTSLVSLDLSRNELTGELSSELGRLTALKVLRLHSNRLSGPLPTTLPTALHVLWLQDNALSGRIPTIALGQLVALQSLYLHDNQLSGDIPVSLCDTSNAPQQNAVWKVDCWPRSFAVNCSCSSHCSCN
ncbi:LRR receptor-like serine threonine-protein kinase [Seminavis robusta]|uniref:LRR receptor-like serine threonine-protein kinase n=1 Tax=Seminavis robusta TaxID=568900 RepID=A0A9N8EA36_9STRA|nr:LRR receptor-like serine threonine-protein kinase [Seminavis robusta]|eukprot:Sro823_g207560.1 LRR receptor-like serine threonine-protein kinase (630) ;mRNA; r:24452-26524